MDKVYSALEDGIFLADVRSIAESLIALISEEREIFINEISKFKKLFSHKNVSAGNYEYEIKLKPHSRITHRTYPVPLKFRESVDNEIDRMLLAGFIEESTSSYCNQLRIVQKN